MKRQELKEQLRFWESKYVEQHDKLTSEVVDLMEENKELKDEYVKTKNNLMKINTLREEVVIKNKRLEKENKELKDLLRRWQKATTIKSSVEYIKETQLLTRKLLKE